MYGHGDMGFDKMAYDYIDEPNHGAVCVRVSGRWHRYS
jgi:hypothetical protein